MEKIRTIPTNVEFVALVVFLKISPNIYIYIYCWPSLKLHFSPTNSCLPTIFLKSSCIYLIIHSPKPFNSIVSTLYYSISRFHYTYLSTSQVPFFLSLLHTFIFVFFLHLSLKNFFLFLPLTVIMDCFVTAVVCFSHH